MEVAYGLARGMAASGITVVSGLAEGIAAAAHQGALQAGARTVTVMAGGVDVANPASWRGLHRRIAAEGCALAELPCGAVARGWCHIARARIVAALARIVIVVEAHEHPAELLHARLAAAGGAAVAAVPGRVCAPGRARPPPTAARRRAAGARPPGRVGRAVRGGRTPRSPCRARAGGPPAGRAGAGGLGQRHGGQAHRGDALGGAPAHEVLVALAELELGGAVARGDGGRYVVCM